VEMAPSMLSNPEKEIKYEINCLKAFPVQHEKNKLILLQTLKTFKVFSFFNLDAYYVYVC
jgi:hypothetical protein